jgi:sodium/proline symporter
MTRNGALAGMVAGAVTVVAWAAFKAQLWDIYEILPGFAAAMAAIVAVSLMDREPAAEIRAEFART